MSRYQYLYFPQTGMTRRKFIQYGTAIASGGYVLHAAKSSPGKEYPEISGRRFLYPDTDIDNYISRMSGAGPFYARGDAGYGGKWSPNDGEHSKQLAEEFLNQPHESYWNQPELPFSSGDPSPPHRMDYARPMHAAF